MTFRLNPALHEAAGALRWLGLRDRLRCPNCKAVGTWKPHGTLWDRWRDNDRPARRWLCKCCGLYYGPEGKLWCFPDRESNVWTLPGEKPYQSTPLEILKRENVWPWRG
jgi:hypothetical protein